MNQIYQMYTSFVIVLKYEVQIVPLVQIGLAGGLDWTHFAPKSDI